MLRLASPASRFRPPHGGKLAAWIAVAQQFRDRVELLNVLRRWRLEQPHVEARWLARTPVYQAMH
jgi:hypothetical protein